MPGPSKLRVLIITRNLPPLVGGMERLNWHMADELSQHAEVKIVGPSGAARTKPPFVTLTEAPIKFLPFFIFVAFLKGLWTALRWKPDVILAGSGLTAPLAWGISKICNSRSSAYLHGFDITVNHGLYRWIWKPIFKKLDIVIVNSTPTEVLAITAGVSKKKITVVYPGVELPYRPQPASNINAFKEKHGLVGKKIILSVGRLTTRKGLHEFVKLALPSIVKGLPDVTMIVIGEAPKNSLGAKTQTVESIQTQAEQSGVAGKIKFLGVITDKNILATAYESADVHVFPVRHIPDDPEGFGMVAIEAAAHSLATVAFATGGTINAVSDGVSGYLIESNDYPELSRHVLQVLNKPMRAEAIYGFAQGFAWKNFGQAIYTAIDMRLNKEP